MSPRTTARLAWSLWAVMIALVAGWLVLGVASRPETPLYGYWVEDSLIAPTFATLGALIVSRRPGNVIGWIFLVTGAGASVQLLSGQYATVALRSQTWPGGATAAWISTLAQSSIVFSTLFLIFLFPTGRLPSSRWRPVAWIAGIVFSTLFLIFLFPTGRLPSSRWRPVAWIAGIVIAVSVAVTALTPGMIEDFPSVRNPFSVESAAAVLGILDAVGGWMGLACFVAAILSLILRFYRSRGDERLQLKWFAYAATLGFLAILFGGEARVSGTLVWTVAPLSLPICAGIAILRYRLYEIDLLINRTLVYGSLTAALALVYVGGVVSLQYAFRALTGSESQIAIVASTLTIAVLFVPLRRRVQGFVDRLFYRCKYDAAKTLETFTSKLRNETDLDSLGDDLAGVVRETVQPTHVSLWMREPG